MTRIRTRRDIFDRNTLVRDLDMLATPEALRAQVVPKIRDAYTHGWDVIAKRFLIEPRATEAVAEGAFLVDSIIKALYELALTHHGTEVSVAIVATGGYGRSEQFPYSDIDLLFLHDAHNQAAKEVSEWMLYGLWDLGVSIGHAVRTLDQTIACAKEDATILTNLLDARFICGNAALFNDFSERFQTHIKSSSGSDFIDAKLAERDKRHQKCGDSRYVLEPNIKEGKGGLRDLQTLTWLARYLYGAVTPADLLRAHLFTEEEVKAFLSARNFLWRVRMHLHLLARRGEERLTFDMQRQVAEALGYYDDMTVHAQERFMKQYFLVARSVGSLTRSVCAVLEEDKKRKPSAAHSERLKGIALEAPLYFDAERLAVKGEDVFKKSPLLLMTLFKIAHVNQLEIHPRTLQQLSRHLYLINASLRSNKQANDAFMDILLSAQNPESTLRRMNEAGVLGRFIPDFGRVIGQMQFDMYHVYTVDEHTIFAIGILHGIATGKYAEEMPIATRIYPLIQSHRVLFLALFAHDIAKGRGGDHSVLGEMVVRKLARRFGFDAHETETCAWLVRYHLLMSRTAFSRDASDPQTIRDFKSKVQTPERLRLLLILTAADIRAVGPGVWSGWKGALLRELYNRTEEAMGASDLDARSQQERSLKKELKTLLSDWCAADIDHYLEQGGSGFWSGCDAATHARIAHLMRESELTGQSIMMHTHSDNFRATTDVVLCMPDSQGLFSRISGAIALCGANILSARIFTLKNGMAVEMFHIQDNQQQAFERPDKLARLSVLVRKAVDTELDIAGEIAALRLTYPSRMDVFKVPPRVLIENKVSATHTVIEVSGRDRVGFLHMVTKVLANLNISISTAHIATYGERAVDVFYVKDGSGHKITHESKIRELHDAIIASLSAMAEKIRRVG